MKYTKFVNLSVSFDEDCWTHKGILDLLQKSGIDVEVTTDGDILPDECTCRPRPR